MRLHQLDYVNFGPFKGDQGISLPDEDGVAVIFGDNNLGKTTILNSVRWLFVGEFLERTGKPRADQELVNREAVTEAGEEPVTASVSATVTWLGDRYKLTRSVAREGDKTKRRLHVIRDSVALSAEDAQATLRQMIPEEIQQFFLFDAEALNRYEDLLHDSTAGAELKEAIERILGVPVLTNTIRDLGTLTETHNKVISRLKTQDKSGETAAKALAQLDVVLEKRKRDIGEIEANIAEAGRAKDDVERKMAASKTARALLEKCDRAKRDLENAKQTHNNALEQFREVAPQAWTAVLTPTLMTKLRELNAQREEIERDQRAFNRQLLLTQLQRELNETGECPCCGQPSHSVKLGEPDARAAEPHSSLDQSTDLEEIRSSIRSLEQILDPDSAARLDERNRVLRDAAMKVNDSKNDLDEAEEAVEGIDDATLRDLPAELSNVKARLQNLRNDLAEAVADRDEDKEEAARLRKIVAEHGGEAGAAATRKQDLLDRLQDICALAIDTYREELRKRVEHEASKVFVSIRSDPEFTGLSINGDYGLSICHKDGTLEPQRSAGYEHIVALSLVAALQRCAPVRGPIFMDMPFARLDPDHTLNTLRALPAVADQVVLIVHEGEIKPTEAQAALGSALVCQRQLVYRSARRTDIVRVGSV